MRDASGWFLVSLLVAFLVFNVAIIIYDSIRILQLHCIRRRNIIKYREQRYSVEKVNEITLKASSTLKEML